ncbi:MAG: AEC family transporter [Proteobacteria bacterium]|nr:AEC family transporter [Pseudomonadota bacterium]
MTVNSITILLPLLILIGGGFLIARFYSLSEGPLVRVVTDFFMPLLVFYSFCTVRIPIDEIGRLAGVVTFVVALMLAVSWLFCKILNLKLQAVAPPLIFMNSGFLGIPIMKLWGGLAAMNLIIIYDQIQTFYIFTLGIVIVTGSFNLKGLKEMIRSPLVWAIILGFGFNIGNVQVHSSLLEAMKFCGDAAPPLATFAIGITLNRYKLSLNGRVIIGVFLRMALGLALGMVAALVFGFSGQRAVVVSVASGLPSAVFSVVLPLRYGVDSKFAGSVLIVSTLLSLLTLPFMFLIAAYVFLG